MKSSLRSIFAFLLITGVATLLTSCSQPPEVYSLQGKTMGTYYKVSFWSKKQPLTDKQLAGIKQELEQTLADVNQSMSTYIEDSELSLLNKAPIEQWIPLSDSLAKVLKTGLDVYELCNGDFDMTVGPLVNLWGFGPDLRPNKIPGFEELQQAKFRVGSVNIELQQQQLKKTRDVYIDLSAFAKGYGVDQLADTLNGLGYQNYLADIGGEIKVKGHKPGKKGWTVAIISPDSLIGNHVFDALLLSDIALATSGDYRNYFEHDGIRYSHTINPATGFPIRHKLASVSVLHPDSMVSDALATCLMVKGEQKGYQWASEHNIAAYFIYRDEDKFIGKATDAFNQQAKQAEIAP